MWLNIIIWSILGAAILAAAPAIISDVVLMWREVMEGEVEADENRVQAAEAKKF